MKPKLIELIPIYGMIKYSTRYFAAQKRGNREARIAIWVEMYHMVTGLIIIFGTLIYFGITPH